MSHTAVIEAYEGLGKASAEEGLTADERRQVAVLAITTLGFPPAMSGSVGASISAPNSISITASGVTGISSLSHETLLLTMISRFSTS